MLFPDFSVNGRLCGSYPEPAFEEVIEAELRGTWTIKALTGEVKSVARPNVRLSDYTSTQIT
jgi:hypothetical protein